MEYITLPIILILILFVIILINITSLKKDITNINISILQIRSILAERAKNHPEKQPVKSPAPTPAPAVVPPVAAPVTSAAPEAPATAIGLSAQDAEHSLKAPQPVKEEITQPVQKEVPQPVAQPVAQPVRSSTPSPLTPFKPVRPQKPSTQSDFFKNLFNENLLGKIGIVTLVAGIGFFVKYAIDQDWINEIGRVSIGILTGVIIISLAHYLHKKYSLFSAILTGGGIAVLYITITLAFREYELFGQTPAFVLLSLVTVFSVLLSLLYNRKELALFSLLGGYASPLLISTGSGNYTVLFSFIIILNTGMLLISMKKKWTVIKIVSFVSTAIFYFSWLTFKFNDEYLGASVFAALFFIQFYVVAISDHLLSEKKLTPLQLLFVLGNNMALLRAGYHIFYGFETNYLGLITILIAVINAVVMIVLLRNSKVDKNMIYMLIAIVLSLVSLAVPIQLKGHVITMFWAAEAVIITWLWQKTRIRIFNIGFQVIHFLIFISWIMDIHNNYNIDGLNIIVNKIFITGLVIIISQILCCFILRKEASEKYFVKILVVLSWISGYFVPFFELWYHFEAIGVLRLSPVIVLFAWTVTYLAILAHVYRKTFPKEILVWGAIGTIGISALFMLTATKWFGYNIFYYENELQSWFMLHYLMLPGLAYLFYSIVSNIRSSGSFVAASWITAFLGVVIILSEADNTLIQIWGNHKNYHTLLHDMHTFGYPILCGIIAMILMIFGLQKKEIILRKIALTFFGIIILKFYLIDVWRMSPQGRILSFVALGVILLLVYFLLQKIKGLITDGEKHPEELNQ